VTKRLGARYGSRLRKKVEEIEQEQRAIHVCDKCGRRAVKRASVGVWVCRKCGFKFAAGAWSPRTT